MSYVDDDTLVKCDLDALYHGDIQIETICTEEIDAINDSEGVLEPDVRPNPPGWDAVDRTCGD